MGKSVSTAIMSNPKERARRATQMVINNRTPQARDLSRNTAKKTSARPEIIAARAANLQRWRDENFDTFYEKCIMKMHSTWHSKPERILRELVQAFDPAFKGNQRLYSTRFTSNSRRKQVDLMNEKTNVIVEFDGVYHFKPIKGEEALQDARKRDNELEMAVVDNEMTLIRISYDQFTYKDGGHFSEHCLKWLFELLKDPKPGVHRIGNSYCTGVIPIPLLPTARVQTTTVIGV